MTLRVLAYHAVSPYPNPLSVDVTRLADQLRHVLRKGLRPVLFGRMAAGRAPDDSFAVTFDDGYLSVYERAREVLGGLGVPATVFLPTGLVGRDGPVSWPGLTPDPMPGDELRPMSWQQVEELVADGWEVGSHTVSHPRLPELDDQALRRELVASRREVEARTGRWCTTLAYPFGQTDRRVVAAARDAGYVGAVTMGRVGVGGPLAVPRIGVFCHDNARRFALKTSRLMRTDAAAAALSVLHGVR